jgi:O-acetyl-ADP-ribose deacetylase (regulator of RNase III)
VNASIDLTRLGIGPLFIEHGLLEERADDAVVTEANTHLQMTSGIAGSLRKAGGIGVHKEAITLGPLAVGRVTRTSSGKLPASVLYHAVLIDFFIGRGMSAKVITAILAELLALAEEDEVRTIAMPLFGGGGGLKPSLALPAIIEGLEDAGRLPGEGPTITLVVRDADEFVLVESLARDLKAKGARRDEENDVAADFLKELMGEMGDLGDMSEFSFEE